MIFYRFLLRAIEPLYRLRVYLRSRHEPDYTEEIAQRFSASALPLLERRPSQKRVLIHAVSVGESNAAAPIIRHLIEQQHLVVVTNTTRTGRAIIRQRFANEITASQLVSLLLPLDRAELVQRLLDYYQPSLVGLIETELWPILIDALNERHIPVVLLNARLSAQSAKGYGRVKQLSQRMIGQLSVIAAQDQLTADRFIQLGALPERVIVTGSLKYDLAPPDTAFEQAQRYVKASEITSRPVWIAASTHEPEERQILALFRDLQSKFPQLLLILVPRHPERFDHVADMITEMGWPLARRSLGQTINTQTPLFLADSMGELWTWYALAAASANGMAFVGGSLSETGGHNPLEPARLGLPVAVGPHTFNFAEIVETLRHAGGLVQIEHSAELAQQIGTWLQQPEQAHEVGQAAQQIVLQNQGALQKQLELIDQLLISP